VGRKYLILQLGAENQQSHLQNKACNSRHGSSEVVSPVHIARSGHPAAPRTPAPQAVLLNRLSRA